MQIWMEKRQSTRQFKTESVANSVFDRIDDWKKNFEFPHHESIDWNAAVVKEGEIIHSTFTGLVSKYIRVTAPHYLMLSSEPNDKDSFLIGFLGESFVKLMTELGIGTCWVGHSLSDEFAKDDLGMPPNHRYHIIIAFGIPQTLEIRKKIRKTKEETISDLKDGDRWLVDALRSSPSAVNSQPWYLYYDEGCYHYMMRRPKVLGLLLKDKTIIDMGIGFYHIYDVIKAKGYRLTWHFESNKNKYGEQILTFKYFE
ncbi:MULTISPECIES: nitroreductase family protein [unclassified Fusibacter]|uniref:nitroreductase family protein n=1 Tax=unclassified Fusibacter TaxID=2624464 RepID=UPI0010102173|nr:MULTISPECIES: nitroreductase family protein [unclassified Fusibacter]MCK8060656.1 hypothetical protein [Fusibacter sp. A2]NPE22890.1 hypothetical protein [Fusibacter sp. A1]RXV59958.1 hypothetical protein DWB64_13675 [Fusibacter sp. A1]